MKVNEIIDVVVDNVEEFAVQVHHRGQSGVVQMGDIQWRFPLKKEDYPKVNEQIKVKLLWVSEDPQSALQFRASIREAHPESNPWADLSHYETGKNFNGTVSMLAGPGAIIELTPGANGLLDLRGVEQQFKVGDKVDVEITKFDSFAKRIELKLS